MIRIILGVEGMACGMCEAHINEAIRNAFRVKIAYEETDNHPYREGYPGTGTERCSGKGWV